MTHRHDITDARLTTAQQMELFGCDLIDLLRREGRHSGVWFADRLLQAADYLERAAVSPQDVEAMRRLLPFHGKTNPYGSRSALIASTKLLRARYEKARCDDEAVSCCSRCNTMFLVNVMDEMIAALTPKEPGHAAR